MKRLGAYLGLDLGEKSLGIAFSQFGIIAKNLKTIYFHSHKYKDLLLPLKKIINELYIQTIILGYPKHMNNDIGIQAKIKEQFKTKIEKFCNPIKIILWDERLTTKQSLNVLSQNNCKKKNIIKLKDEYAAMLILQNFLNFYNNHNK